MKKLLTAFMTLMIIISGFSNSYAQPQQTDKIHLMITGFASVYGYSDVNATDSGMASMPFSKQNYNITNPGNVYDYNKKLVKSGFGSSYLVGDTIDLSFMKGIFDIKDVTVKMYDPSDPDLGEDKWSPGGIDIASGKTVALNGTSRALGKAQYDDEYYNRRTGMSNLKYTYNKQKMSINYTFTNNIPSFDSLGGDIDTFSSKIIRLDDDSRESFAISDTLISSYLGDEWKGAYPAFHDQVLKAAVDAGNAKKIRSYMFFSSVVIEITIDMPVELAMADTVNQVAPGTSFKDGTGTTRDKLEIFDKNGNIVMGKIVIPGEKYKMCSYILNKGQKDTTTPVAADFYLVDHDLGKVGMPHGEKTSLGSSSSEQADLRGPMPKDRMGTYCKELSNNKASF